MNIEASTEGQKGGEVELWMMMEPPHIIYNTLSFFEKSQVKYNTKTIVHSFCVNAQK